MNFKNPKSTLKGIIGAVLKRRVSEVQNQIEEDGLKWVEQIEKMRVADLPTISKKDTFKTFKRHKSLLPHQQIKELQLQSCDTTDPAVLIKILDLNQQT